MDRLSTTVPEVETAGSALSGSSVDGLCSIIMPCYNRAEFLSDAVAAIRAQTYDHWELIFVDDGSRDGSAELFERLVSGVSQRVRTIRQENRGAYAARWRGVTIARGQYVAFYDTDDLWLSHHLKVCVEHLELDTRVDWVYGASRRLEVSTGRVVEPNSFYDRDGQPRAFLGLRTRDVGNMKVFDDSGITVVALGPGLRCGLHSSVIKRTVFEHVRFRTDLPNGEDRFFAIRALKAGATVGYFDNVHQNYRIHTANSSAVAESDSVEHRLRVYSSLAKGYEGLFEELDLDAQETTALRQQIATLYFWDVGYSILAQAGRLREATGFYRKARSWWPWTWRMWKTYLLARTRIALSSERV